MYKFRCNGFCFFSNLSSIQIMFGTGIKSGTRREKIEIEPQNSPTFSFSCMKTTLQTNATGK